MFAVIKTGGKQYRVAADDVLQIGNVVGEVGDIVEIGHVLAYGNGDDVTIGAPFVDGALVTAEVVAQGRGAKVIAFKKRRRQNSRRKRGHRQYLTTVRISEILFGGAKPSKKAAAKTEKTEKADKTAEAGAAAKKPAKAPAKAKEAAASTEAAGFDDDVSLISGVGPVLKEKLAAAGITSLKQIAAWKKKDIAKFDEELDFAGRIERDEWVAQAKELIAGKPPRAKVDQEKLAQDEAAKDAAKSGE
ncbi:MAG: 50S ribosomal protein L21 [Rhizobiaceae bacterium]|nr:50S ribosomal protein L21 [Rhizobiaceae bacterium]